MTEQQLTKRELEAIKKREEELANYTLEKRTINGQEIEVKVYKETKKRPVTQYCR